MRWLSHVDCEDVAARVPLPPGAPQFLPDHFLAVRFIEDDVLPRHLLSFPGPSDVLSVPEPILAFSWVLECQAARDFPSLGNIAGVLDCVRTP